MIDPKRKGVGESIYSGFTHNPHHLSLDSVIDPKGLGRAFILDSHTIEVRHNPHHLILDSVTVQVTVCIHLRGENREIRKRMARSRAEWSLPPTAIVSLV